MYKITRTKKVEYMCDFHMKWLTTLAIKEMEDDGYVIEYIKDEGECKSCKDDDEKYSSSLTQVGSDSVNDESSLIQSEETYSCTECDEVLNEELICSCCLRKFILQDGGLYMTL